MSAAEGESLVTSAITRARSSGSEGVRGRGSESLWVGGCVRQTEEPERERERERMQEQNQQAMTICVD